MSEGRQRAVKVRRDGERRPVDGDVAPLSRVAPDVRHRLVRLPINCLGHQPSNYGVCEVARLKLKNTSEPSGKRAVEATVASDQPSVVHGVMW